MADAAKHLQINGGTIISDIKSLFSILRTRRTVAFAYGFVFAFVCFTAFFAFNPSPNSSSPWFSNIFTLSGSSHTDNTDPSSSSSSSSSSAAVDSKGSRFSSIYSYFFPNSSQSSKVPNYPNFAPPSPTQIRSNSTKVPTFEINKNLPNISNNQSNSPVLKPNQTIVEAPFVTTPPSVKNESKDAILKPKQTIIEDPVVAAPANVKKESKGEVLMLNQTAIQEPLTSNSSNHNDHTPKNSTLVKKGSGKDGKGAIEKGVISNYTASLLKKHQSDNGTALEKKQQQGNLVESLLNCKLFDGNWVRDDSYPLYKPDSCSLIDEQFRCVLNGRPDTDYQKLKWKPKGCTLPRLDASHMLEMLRGKRLVFVGDSLNRNMWESLICILKSSIKDQSKVYEASGRHHFRTEASYSFIFEDYKCSVEFYVSPFLVREWEISEKTGTKKETLRLDLIGQSSDLYKGADFIIFNTGHWWTHDKTSKGEDYYQEGSHVYHELNVLEAFRKALTTWARWVDHNVNPKKTSVFFRGYSASHFSGGQWNSGGQCDHETQPIKNETYLSAYPSKMLVLERVIHGMKTPITYLNITRITDYRKDGHPSVYRKQYLSPAEKKSPLHYQDCSHWCLPGVPDVWNELLYAELLIKEYQQKKRQ